MGCAHRRNFRPLRLGLLFMVPGLQMPGGCSGGRKGGFDCVSMGWELALEDISTSVDTASTESRRSSADSGSDDAMPLSVTFSSCTLYMSNEVGGSLLCSAPAEVGSETSVLMQFHSIGSERRAMQSAEEFAASARVRSSHETAEEICYGSSDAPPEGTYVPYFVGEGPAGLEDSVISLSATQMVITFTDPEGTTYTVTFDVE